MAQRIVYWFRNDLRLNDNEALYTAATAGQEVIPVYVFDPRQFENTRLGFRRTGALRAQFQIECVIDLRNRLREKGGDLLVRIGEPEKIIAELAETYQAEYVFTSKEIAPEETRIESSLSKRLKISNIDIRLFWMDTLSQVTDLPFSVSKLPLGFAQFQNQVKGHLKIKEPLPAPERVTLPQDFEAGIIPSLPKLGIDPQEMSNSNIKDGALPRGGETMALAKMDEYIKNSPQTEIDPDSVDLLTDSQLSNWLSLGCISARYIYKTVSERITPSALTETLLNNLLARDYFHWTLLRFGPRMFKPSGIKHNFNQPWLNDSVLFEKWSKGETENESVNAIMQKLLSSGDLSSGERKAAAAHLVHDLTVNWTWGAMYFESFLIDYDVSVNWGKWNNLAGVGAD
ncbi:deoxyribodipyrimidine photo-lyase [Dyadobacter psychrotolerans]|uniref:Cryptochrome DASH n=1 Tax=Dyadobacter psychrotolerans TaxID=2541721 RepID=A0A4R5DEV5_9BACT|nr:deoxyribodipyrimidine photo-lyase [Dyadobacter psychrotolerans]TDE11677.1 cryptochrome DASH [Dyadobacter psychrotolerans]